MEKSEKRSFLLKDQNPSYHSDRSEQKLTSSLANEDSKVNQANCLKRGKTQVTKSRLVLVLHLIGWESGASFLDQSQAK